MRRFVKSGSIWPTRLRDAAGIIMGVLMAAVSLNMFLIPHRLAAGGISGLGVVLFHQFGVPVGATILLANLPIFLAAYLVLGRKVVVNSLLGALLLPVAVELLSFLPSLVDDILLASVYGGIGMGVGLGLVFNFRGSTGGTALSSLLLNRWTGVSTGQGLVGSDILIIAAGALVFGLEPAMYAALSLFVSSKLIDVIQEGLGQVKVALVVTEEHERLSRKIFEELDRGVTFLEGRGGYTGRRREILLCAVTRFQVSSLKNLVYETDPAAFIMIGSATEVLGEGFKTVSGE